MKVAEIFAKLGFDVDNRPLEAFTDNLKSVARELTITMAAATAALYAIDRFVASFVRGSLAMDNFRRQTGLSVQELQKWQSAASLSNIGMEAEQVTQSIQALQQNMIQITRFGSGNMRPFAILGIDPRNSPFEVLEQLRQKAKNYDPAIFATLIKEMGLDPQFVNVLKLSNEEFDKFSRIAYRSKETQSSIMKVGSAVKMMKVEFDVWRDNFVAKNEPALM